MLKKDLWNEELKAKWVAALRSGEYKQGRPSDLKDSRGGYCCLGVLSSLIENDPKPSLYTAYNVIKLDAARTEEISKKALGYSNSIDEVFWMLNDGNEKDNIRRHSFAEIADFIEENL